MRRAWCPRHQTWEESACPENPLLAAPHVDPPRRHWIRRIAATVLLLSLSVWGLSAGFQGQRVPTINLPVTEAPAPKPPAPHLRHYTAAQILHKNLHTYAENAAWYYARPTAQNLFLVDGMIALLPVQSPCSVRVYRQYVASRREGYDLVRRGRRYVLRHQRPRPQKVAAAVVYLPLDQGPIVVPVTSTKDHPRPFAVASYVAIVVALTCRGG